MRLGESSDFLVDELTGSGRSRCFDDLLRGRGLGWLVVALHIGVVCRRCRNRRRAERRNADAGCAHGMPLWAEAIPARGLICVEAKETFRADGFAALFAMLTILAITRTQAAPSWRA